MLAKEYEESSCKCIFLATHYLSVFLAFRVQTIHGWHEAAKTKFKNRQAWLTGIRCGCYCVKVSDATLYEARSAKVEQNHTPVLETEMYKDVWSMSLKTSTDLLTT